MADVLNSDGMQLTQDEATELCVHHLRLARIFFEVTPDDNGAALEEEIKRTILKRDGEEHAQAALLWVRAETEYYESLKVND